MRFSNWLKEWADFGLDNNSKDSPLEHPSEDPILRLNVEYVIRDLKRHNLGIHEAKEGFYGECQWGTEPGAIKVNFGPYGGLRATIRKLTTDADGDKMWVCKEVIMVKNYFDHNPDALIAKLHERLENYDQQNIDSPKKDWNKLEDFVLKLAPYLKNNTTQKPLFFEGIRRIKQNEHYIIHFGCKGAGVQRQDQKRLDQFQIEVTYDKKGGFIKVVGQELGDRIRSHRWSVDPSEFIEYFMPSQPEKEIMECVLVHLNSY